MSEKFPANFSSQLETEPAADDSYEVGFEEELNPELETLRQLENHFGDTIFYYKDYEGTVAFLYASACPAFPFVLGKGFEYAVGWLESKTDAPNKTMDEEEKPTEVPEKPTSDIAKPDVDSAKPEVEVPVAALVVEAKTDAATQSPEATSAPPSIPEQAPAPAAQVEAAEMPVSSEVVAKSETVQPTATQAQKGSGVSVSQTETETTTSEQVGIIEEVAPDSTPTQLELQPEAKVAVETSELVSDTGRSTIDVIPLPGQVPEIEVLAPVEIAPVVVLGESSIEAQTSQIEDDDILAGEQTSDSLAEPTLAAEINEVAIDHSTETEVLLAPEIPTVEAITEMTDELPTELYGLYEDKSEFESFEAATPDNDLEDMAEVVHAQNLTEDETETVPQYEFNADEVGIDLADIIDKDLADDAANDFLEQQEAPAVGSTENTVEAMETSGGNEPAEAGEEIATPVQDIVELMAEITYELPDTLPETIPKEAVEQVSKVARAIQKLEIARSAEQCHEALTVIRSELASLLRLLGYDNADAIAERMVQQYDMATLKQYLAQLVRLLESRRSESTLTRLITPKPSHRLFGIHAVGRVVMLGSAAA